MIDERHIAYAAGFFDGEGTVSMRVSRQAKYAYPFYSIQIQAVQLAIHPEPLNMLRELFGGHINTAKGRKGNQRPQLVWRVAGDKAHAAIRAMLPYLTVKKAVAMLALLFWTWKQVHGKAGANISEAEHNVLDTLYNVIKYYNGGPHLGVAPETPEALADGGQNGSRREAVH